MRKLILLILAFAITACGAPPATPTEVPTQEVVQPTQTAAVVIQTVVVTVVPTDMPTVVPSATPLPPPTEVPPTAVPPTAVPATEAVAGSADTNGGPITLDNAMGGGWFTNLTLTGNNLALRCPDYQEITLSVTPSDAAITQVDFYYRIEDRSTGAIFDWQGPRRILGDGQGNYRLTFTGEDVNVNFRKPNAWFDFQFVGISRSGGHVGNSEKIVQQVNYMFDCP
jgi:Predicted solute binding protein